MALPARMRFGIFVASFHWLGENPTLSLERDMELLEWLDHWGFDGAWIGEHHSGGWERHRIARTVYRRRRTDPANQARYRSRESALPSPVDGDQSDGAPRPYDQGARHARRRPRHPRVGRLHAWHRPSDAAPSHGRVTGHYHTASNRDPAYHIRGQGNRI